MHRLPGWFHKLSVLVMFAIELVAPLFVFTPPPFSSVAGAAFVLLMLLIMATGNYCFFNCSRSRFRFCFSTMPLVTLCKRFSPNAQFQFALSGSVSSGWPLWLTVPVALVVALLSVDVIGRLVRFMTQWPKPFERLIEWLEPFHWSTATVCFPS